MTSAFDQDAAAEMTRQRGTPAEYAKRRLAGLVIVESKPDLELDLDGTEPDRQRRARVTWASAIEPAPVVWAWQPDGNGRIPAGSLSVAAGREGTGKSSFGIWLAAHITRGTLPGSFQGTARNTLYVAVEDSWAHTLVPRMIAADADLDRVGRFDVVIDEDDETILSLPYDNALLEQAVVDNDVALVVIDPLMSVIGAKVDTHRERDVRTALDPLARIADRTGCVILGIAHFNKGSSTDAASLITGSGAFKNVPRSVFGFARDDDDTGGRVLTQVKNSLGRDDLDSLAYRIDSVDVSTPTGIAVTGQFTLTGRADRSVGDILRDSRNGSDDGDDRNELDGWLRDYLVSEDGTAPAAEVYKDGARQGYSRSAIDRARRRIKATSHRSGFGKGSTVLWSLDPTPPP